MLEINSLSVLWVWTVLLGSLHEVFQRCRSSSADPSTTEVSQGRSEAPSNLGFRMLTLFKVAPVYFLTSTHSGRRCKTTTRPSSHYRCRLTHYGPGRRGLGNHLYYLMSRTCSQVAGAHPPQSPGWSPVGLTLKLPIIEPANCMPALDKRLASHTGGSFI